MHVLVNELSTDPLKRGYATMSVQQIIDSLRALDRSHLVAISSSELLGWCAGGAEGLTPSRIERLEAAKSAHANLAIRGVCKAAYLLISRDGTSLDLNLADRAAMFGALVAGQVISAAERDQLYAIATRYRSRADELGLGEIQYGWLENMLEENGIKHA